MQFDVRWGATFNRQQCNHCGGTFIAPKEKEEKDSNGEAKEEVPDDESQAVIFPRIRCPECNSKDQKVAKSPKPKEGATVRQRLHKCKACGWSFESTEVLGD